MEIRTFIDIAAPPHRVWSLLADFAGYDRWNPMLKRMRGAARVGSTVRFAVTAGPLPVPLSAEVITVETDRELAWLGPARPKALRRVISGEHWFRLTPTTGPDGAVGTYFEHGEIFRGAVMPARWDRVEAAMRPVYEAMNRAVKRESESMEVVAPRAAHVVR
jgi:hypothetical protein